MLDNAAFIVGCVLGLIAQQLPTGIRNRLFRLIVKAQRKLISK